MENIKAYIHIGLEKTGTTSLQTFLALNYDPLRERSILVPFTGRGEPAHLGLTCFCLNNDSFGSMPRGYFDVTDSSKVGEFRERITKELRNEITAGRPETIIFSDEHLSSHLLTCEEIMRLRDLCHDLDLVPRIIVYLRRQDVFFDSSYETFVKAGFTDLKPREILTEKIVKHRYDYQAILDKWRNVFGAENMIVRLYAQDLLVEHDIIFDFMEAIGIGDMGRDHLTMPDNLNRSSTSPTALEFARLFNTLVPPITAEGRLNPDRGNFYSFIEGCGSGGKLRTKTGCDLLRSLKQSNIATCNEYQLDQSRMTIPDGMIEDCPDDMELTLEQAIHIAAELWSKQQRSIHRLESEVQRLHKLNSEIAAELDNQSGCHGILVSIRKIVQRLRKC